MLDPSGRGWFKDKVAKLLKTSLKGVCAATAVAYVACSAMVGAVQAMFSYVVFEVWFGGESFSTTALAKAGAKGALEGAVFGLSLRALVKMAKLLGVAAKWFAAKLNGYLDEIWGTKKIRAFITSSAVNVAASVDWIIYYIRELY